jgi:hypothetical protein
MIIDTSHPFSLRTIIGATMVLIGISCAARASDNGQRQGLAHHRRGQDSCLGFRGAAL